MRTLYNPEKAFSYHLYGSGEDGLVTFVLSIPISQLDAFISYADQRKRIFEAPIRVSSPESKEVGRARELVFRKKILSVFDDFIKKDFSRNEAISKTNQLMKEKGFCNCSYDITKNIVNCSIKLRKTL